MEALASAVKKEKGIKDIKIWKEEVKLYLFADDTIIYIEDLKESIKQVSELISEFSIVRKMRLLYKNQMHFYMLSLNNIKTEINLTNYLQNIYS